MDSTLYDKQPLVLDRVLAKHLGTNKALVIQQVHYWLKINEKSKKNFYKERYWTFNSINKWHKETFTFISYDTVKTTFKDLRTMGILLTQTFNKKNYDKTLWYSIDYEKLDEIIQSKISMVEIPPGGKIHQPLGGIPPEYWGGNTQPIPDNTTEITTENNIIINNDTMGENPPSFDDAEVRKNDFKRVKDYYSKFIEGKDIITFNIEKQLYDFYKVLGLELVLFAIDKACEYNVKNFKYVRGILNNLIKNNITTLEEAKSFKPNKKQQSSSKTKDLTPDELDDYLFGN